MSVETPGKSSRVPLLAIGGILVVALLVGGALRLTQGNSGDQSDKPPSPQDLPSDVVAVVSGAPASLETVRRVEFDQALDQAAAQTNLKQVPQPGDKKYSELKETALGELLDAIWIQGQAEEMGISVTREEINTKREELKEQAFGSDAEYREFLDQSHYSGADVDNRVKVQVFSTLIQRRLKHRFGPGEKRQQKAFADFVKRYTARWRARTVCAPAYVIERCSNGKGAKAPAGEGSTPR